MGKLDRALEYIPDDETLLEREKHGQGLTRPELSVLIAYSKWCLKSNWLVMTLQMMLIMPIY